MQLHATMFIDLRVELSLERVKKMKVLKETSIIHGIYSERSTVKIKAMYSSWDIPTSQSGNENQSFRKNQAVVSTGEGTIKAGVEMIIDDIMNNNGYIRYYANGVWHNQEDIVALRG